MEKELLLQIIAQQVVILKRLEKLEFEIRGGMRSAPIQSYVDELAKEAAKISHQIRV